MVIDPPLRHRSPVDPVLRALLDDARQRAEFFQGPAAWLREHARPDPVLLEDYARALARELVPGAPSVDTPTWLIDRAACDDLLHADPARADEIRMAAAAVAAGAAVVSAAAAVVTAVVAVANMVSGTPPPPPPPPPKVAQ